MRVDVAKATEILCRLLSVAQLLLRIQNEDLQGRRLVKYKARRRLPYLVVRIFHRLTICREPDWPSHIRRHQGVVRGHGSSIPRVQGKVQGSAENRRQASDAETT